ncbi:uncharacterized protein LOC129984015 [Argiope bruennichi]|uniref:BTB/POZ domain-containing protein 6-A n=1 Tax=Argiope bruennichi TaxID=94029 RepID=A0A8T0EKA9_ARGBR|nr:uncharacterized protein LOC129984015 [Argiope bruennichi]KAF8774028.1 BTB/POZ domain-containing protein 6-A [Argiope bruennichi]
MSKLLRKIVPGKSSKKKLEKEISLIVEDPNNPDGFALKVQKKLLLEHSAFFRDIPENDIKKNRKIKLEDVSVIALQKIVTYMQKASARFQSHVEAIETLKAAQKFEIEELFNICINHLITALEPSNVCDIYDTASTLSLSHLEYSCLKLIDKDTEKVLQTRGFLTLKKARVLEIIKRSSLNIDSEVAIFRAILAWGLNDSLSRGLDPNDLEMFLPIVRHMLNHVRFGNMTDAELRDPEVDKFLQLLSSCELWNKNRSVSCVSQTSSSSMEHDMRQYVTHYSHDMSVYESNQHTVKDGESFCLNIEILKGRVFLTRFKLAFRAFAPTKNAACLYVVLSATNEETNDQRSTRGTFLNTTDEAYLEFSNPLPARESNKVKIELIVKKAENICPLSVKSDIQIAMPDSKMVAMKIIPMDVKVDSEEEGRCIFGEIQYFH